MHREHDASRRKLLKGSAIATTPLLGSLQAFAARNAQGRNTGVMRSSYGPLRPTRDLSTGLDLLQLPDGFQYKSFSWTGDPMENGQPVPSPQVAFCKPHGCVTARWSIYMRRRRATAISWSGLRCRIRTWSRSPKAAARLPRRVRQAR